MGYLWMIKQEDFKAVLKTVSKDFQTVVNQAFKPGKCFGSKVQVVYYGEQDKDSRIEEISLPERLKEYEIITEVVDKFRRLSIEMGFKLTSVSIEHNDVFVSQ